MKVLILKNRISKSLKPKLNNVKRWFSPVIDLEFTEEETNFNIINGDYTYFDVNGKQQSFKGVEEDWYDQNISIPARDRGFDIVIFIIEAKSWLSKIVDGFGTSTPDFFVEEIAIQYFKSGTYRFNDVKLKGDKLEWILIHEIIHRLYNNKKLQDNTHKYFLEATPEKCLEDFKQTEPKVILTRLNDNGKQTTGVFDMYNNNKNIVCYSLELPWRDNKKNISCIPKGTYKCTLYNSPKFGKVYKVLNVPNRTNILIHIGNYNSQTQGCIMLGDELKDINKDGQKDVINSKLTLSKFMLFMGGKDFTLDIK